MTTRIGVIVMTLLLAIYLGFAVQYGVILIAVGQPVPVALGVALLVLPVLAAVMIAAEFVFAVRAERLAKRLEREGGLPRDPLPVSASGRVDRAAAVEAFPRYQLAVESSPDDWASWFRLALAYEGCGDRRRARWATRRAITLERGSR